MKAPRYLAIAAVSLDGRIAAHSKQFSGWTSPEDKKFMRALLDTCDVVIVGNSTYKTAKKPLSKRNCIVLTRSVKATKRAAPNLLYLNTKGAGLKRVITASKYTKVAVLGGAQVYTYCLENGMMSDLYLTIEPIIFGNGIPLFEGRLQLRKPKIVSMRKLNKKGSILLHALI